MKIIISCTAWIKIPKGNIPTDVFKRLPMNCYSEQLNILKDLSQSSPQLISEAYQGDKLEAGLVLYFLVSNRERSEGLTDSQPLAVLLSEWVSRAVSQTGVQATAQHIRKGSSCLKGEMFHKDLHPKQHAELNTTTSHMSVQGHTLLGIEMTFRKSQDQSCFKQPFKCVKITLTFLFIPLCMCCFVSLIFYLKKINGVN